MNQPRSTLTPCNDWLEMLAKPVGDLSLSERVALEAHIAFCPACSLAQIDYRMISDLIRSLPEPDFPLGLPPRMQQLLHKEAHNRENIEAFALEWEMPQTAQFVGRKNEILSPLDCYCFASARSNDLESRTIVPQSEQKTDEQPLTRKVKQECFIKEEAELPSNETVVSISSVSKTHIPSAYPLLPLLGKVLLLTLRLMWDKYTIRCWSMRREDRYVDRVLVCHDCNQQFLFSADEQRSHRQKGLHIVPSQCHSCRKTSHKVLPSSEEVQPFKQIHTSSIRDAN